MTMLTVTIDPEKLEYETIIESGAKIIKLENNSDDNCTIYCEGEPFLFITKNSFSVIDCKSFMVRYPLKNFPKLVLKSNCKIDYYIFK